MGHAPPRKQGKPPLPSPPRATWHDAVVALYLHSPDMEVDEFERLLDVALTGQRPDHPGLPAYLPLTPGGLPSAGRRVATIGAMRFRVQ